MSDRRAFLRGLVSLPLIGGGVTLIGQPTAAAVPITRDLQERYIAWLANEHAAALYELSPPHRDGEERVRIASDWSYARLNVPLHWFPPAPDIECLTAWSRPSTRAAVVLSAAGIPLTGGTGVSGT